MVFETLFGGFLEGLWGIREFPGFTEGFPVCCGQLAHWVLKVWLRVVGQILFGAVSP